MELKKGETIMTDAALHLPAAFLHEAFSKRSGVPLDHFELYYRGKRLEGEAVLSSYGVEKGSTLEVKMRGRGGADARRGREGDMPGGKSGRGSGDGGDSGSGIGGSGIGGVRGRGGVEAEDVAAGDSGFSGGGTGSGGSSGGDAYGGRLGSELDGSGGMHNSHNPERKGGTPSAVYVNEKWPQNGAKASEEAKAADVKVQVRGAGVTQSQAVAGTGQGAGGAAATGSIASDQVLMVQADNERLRAEISEITSHQIQAHAQANAGSAAVLSVRAPAPADGILMSKEVKAAEEAKVTEEANVEEATKAQMAANTAEAAEAAEATRVAKVAEEEAAEAAEAARVAKVTEEEAAEAAEAARAAKVAEKEAAAKAMEAKAAEAKAAKDVTVATKVTAFSAEAQAGQGGHWQESIAGAAGSGVGAPLQAPDARTSCVPHALESLSTAHCDCSPLPAARTFSTLRMLYTQCTAILSLGRCRRDGYRRESETSSRRRRLSNLREVREGRPRII